MSAIRQGIQDKDRALTGRDVRASFPWKRAGSYITLALVFFLLGFIPIWLKVREISDQRDAAQRELRLSAMQITLSSAVIDARRGEYEPARQTASDFFATLRDQLATGDESALTPVQRDNLRPLLTKRYEINTLLSRSDPASADRLSDMYVTYRQAISNIQAHDGSR